MGIVDPIRDVLGFGAGTDSTREGVGGGAPPDAGPALHDHFRAGDDAPISPGVYRVVGRADDAVTLLRIAEDGRRVNSGVVAHVSRADLDALAPAGNPDTGLGRLRQAPGTLAERPLYAGLGLLLVAFGAYELSIAGDGDGLIAVAGGVVVLWMLLR